MQPNPDGQAVQPRKRYLRAKAAAAYLCIGTSTLWEWTKQKEDFPQPIRPSRSVTLFDLDAIEAFLASKQEEAQV